MIDIFIVMTIIIISIITGWYIYAEKCPKCKSIKVRMPCYEINSEWECRNCGTIFRIKRDHDDCVLF